ncbi:hypothetical protein PVK06_048697 [Gossypium arboreum]|uniref:CCHC-type domain-containing protein n=1 Tax=Gossypium arboreum TaxID=29729 RepID=A0ABR0MGK4_GOSAR|nr:hypothetical protein PVK06_048697 [Gossypium arboreum]
MQKIVEICSQSSQLSGNDGEGDPHPDGGRNTKKVRFKDSVVEEDISMAVDPEPQQIISWKDKLLGNHVDAPTSDRVMTTEGNDNDFELLEGDVNTSIIDGIPAIEFSSRIREIFFKEMELMVIVKLLGRNIGYNALYNRILFLWKPIHSIRLMDIANGYFLVKFQDTVLTWIRLPNLSGHLDKRKIIEVIGGLIGKVVKLDTQTDNQIRGRYARLAVYINLDRPLTSQVLIASLIQRVEYEALLTVCFECGKYGHVKEMCTSVVLNQNSSDVEKLTEASQDMPMVREGSLPYESSNGGNSGSDGKVKGPDFEPWMVVERRPSQFSALLGEEDLGVDLALVNGGFLKSGKGDKVADRTINRNVRDFNRAGNSMEKSGQSLNKGMGLSKSPNRQRRQFLWSELRKSIPLGQSPWIAVGDFNVILSTSEKSEGLSRGKGCPYFGIPDYLINVIMPCISNASMQVRWNGVPLSKFRPVRGIQQGCPLSPYLFVLCMEWLCHLIQFAISEDGLVIFSKADLRYSEVLKSILDDFCTLSGHKVNARKTNIFFSKGVDEITVNMISNRFGFQQAHNLGHYLRVPLFHQRVTSSTLQFVVEKVCSKLQNWEAKKLSVAGHVNLAQSVHFIYT